MSSPAFLLGILGGILFAWLIAAALLRSAVDVCNGFAGPDAEVPRPSLFRAMGAILLIGSVMTVSNLFIRAMSAPPAGRAATTEEALTAIGAELAAGFAIMTAFLSGLLPASIFRAAAVAFVYHLFLLALGVALGLAAAAINLRSMG